MSQSPARPAVLPQPKQQVAQMKLLPARHSRATRLQAQPGDVFGRMAGKLVADGTRIISSRRFLNKRPRQHEKASLSTAAIRKEQVLVAPPWPSPKRSGSTSLTG